MRQRVDGILIQNNHLLLMQDFSESHRYPPGGSLEQGETPHQALIRERKEECGADITIGKQLTTYSHTNITYKTLLQNTSYLVSLDSPITFTHELRWFSYDEITGEYYYFPQAFREYVIPLLHSLSS